MANILVLNPSSYTFADPAAPHKDVTISGGTGSYTGASSNNNNVAKVSSFFTTDFWVQPVGAGTCTITVTDSANNTGTMTVTVNPALSLSPTSLSLYAGGATGSITASSGATPYTASSSNTSVATVSVNGSTITVTPVAAGSATITVQDQDLESATCAVTVATPMTLSPTSMTFNVPTSPVQTATISGGLTPYSTSSSNSSIATASVSGNTVTVTPHGSGTCTITVNDAVSGSKTIAVTVLMPPSVSPSSLNFTDPLSGSQSAAISNGTAPYSASSSNASVATGAVTSSTLTVTPKGTGSATITITDANGSTTTLSAAVGSALSVSPSSIDVDSNSAAQTATLNYGRAPYTLQSNSNSSIASASLSGSTLTVTPQSPGSTTITVADADGETATVAVTIATPVSVSPTALTVYTGSNGSAAISNGIAPYTVQSSDTSKATVSVSGSAVTVTPQNPGACTITVTDHVGTTATISVNVFASKLTATPSSLSFADATKPAQTTTISGGVSPYSILTQSNTSIATASLSGSTLTVTPVAHGSCAVVVADSEGQAQQVEIDITVQPPMTLGNSSMTFGNPNAAAQISQISGGDGNYSIYTAPSSSIAKAVIITGNALQVTPVGQGTTTIVIHDGSGHSVTQNVTVNVTNSTNTPVPAGGQGGYPAHVSVWSSQWADATLLTVLDCVQLSFQNNQFGGPGAGKFTIWSKYEDPNQTANLLAGNRIDTYLYRDTLAQSAANAATTINVNVGSRFKAGDHICVYDGVNQTFTVVQSVSSNALTISPALTSAFAVNTTVGTLRYRGLITARTRTPQLDYHTDVETLGYFNYQLTRVVNFGCNQRECGWLIYQLLNQYASEVDLTINASNFVMTTDTKGAVNGSGTNVYYTNQVADRALLSVIQDIIKTANGGGDTQYSLYIDANNVVHFGVLNATSPTVTYTLNPQAVPGDGVADIVGDLQTRDQDVTNLYNVYKLTGGQDSFGNPVTVEVEDDKSVQQYGQKETYLSFPNITDEDTLKSYGKALLDMTAWPLESASMTLIATGAYASAQDYIQVGGFTDGSTLKTNVQSVETTWSAGQDVQQKLNLAELIPDKNRIMSQIAAQHYYANNGTLIGGVSLTDRFVQTGLQGSINAAEDVFSLTAGTIYANVLVSGQQELTQFNVPAYTFTPSSDGLWVVIFSYANSDGTQTSKPQVQAYLNTTSLAASQYIPLYRLTVLGGVIVDATDVRNVGGISTPNITPGSITSPSLAADPNITTAPALATGTALSGPVYYNAGSGSYDAGLTFTLNVGNPSWMAGIRMFAVPHGQSFAGNAIPKGDYAANARGVYEPVIDGLAAGAQYDIYVARVDIAGNPSAALLLCTTAANPLLVDTSALPAMPDGTTPNIVGTPTLAYPSVGGGTFDCDAAVTLDSVGTESSSWLQLIEAVAQPLGASEKWTIYNAQFANSNGVYTIVYGGLGSGTQYQLGLRYVDFRGKRSTVSVVGTTAKNPIQGFLPTSILDSSSQLPYSYTPGPIKNVIDPNGTLNVAPPGGTTGTLPYNNNGVQFTSTIAQQPDANGSYLLNNTVVTRNVQPVNILNTQLAQNRYSTNLTNTKTSAGTWYDTTTSAAVASNTVLANGDQLTYDVGTALDAGSSNAAQDTLTLAANASVTLLFKHQAFKAGGNGILNVLFTGGSVSTGANVQQSTVLSGSDQPTISHTTSSGTANTAHSSSISGFSSKPSITASSGTSYVNTQHSGSAASANTSQASLSYTDNAVSGQTGPSGSATITAQPYATYTLNDPNPDPIPGQKQTPTYSWTPDGTAITGGGSSTVTLPSNTDGSQPLTINNTFTGGTDGSFYVTLYTAAGAIIGTYSGLSSGTFSLGAGWGQGAQAYQVEIGITPNAGDWDGSGTAHGTAQQYTSSWSATLGYSQRGTSGKNGAWTTICSTPGSTVAPVDAAHELTLQIGNVNAPSDSNGATRIDVQLLNPSGGVAQTWTGVASNSTLTYYTGAAPAGAYTWQYQTVVTSTTGSTTSTYTGSITATPSWYQADASSTTSYGNTDGAGTQYLTAQSTVAPTGASTAVQLVLSALTCPSDANGSSELVATLTDPNGNVVFNEPVTATGTYSYYSAGAVAGQYTWTLFGRIKTDNNTGASTYTVTASGYVEWYQADPTSSTTWYNNAGTAQSYTTPSNTVAPTAAATQLQLVLSSVTTPSNSAGTTAVYVTLKDPSGTQVYSSGGITAAQTISYSNASAIAGTYTWTIWAAPTSNDTNDSTYSCSWSGTHSWYQAGPSGGNTYVLAQDGVTQRLATTDANVQMSYVSADTVSFKIYNNASQSVTCQIGLDVHGD